jgi:hypothetical protein
VTAAQAQIVDKPPTVAPRRMYWGVLGGVTPRWWLPDEWKSMFEDATRLEGREIRIGITRGRPLGYEFGFSYVRKSLTDFLFEREGALVFFDPTINQIGKNDHPDHPYGQWVGDKWVADERVTIHLDDGRSFVRKPEHKAKYDLAVYALVDSLVLHSGYSSLRLENFLFTKEAFEDVKSTLKPGGVFIMYNYFRFGWVAGRLRHEPDRPGIPLGDQVAEL